MTALLEGKDWCSDDNTDGFNFSVTDCFQRVTNVRIQDSRVEAAVGDQVHDVATGTLVTEELT